MLISEKTTGSIKKNFASKEAYPIVRQLEKITVKKAEAKVVKCAKNKSWVPRTSLGHLSVNNALRNPPGALTKVLDNVGDQALIISQEPMKL